MLTKGGVETSFLGGFFWQPNEKVLLMTRLIVKRGLGLAAVLVGALCVPPSPASAKPASPGQFATHATAIPGLAPIGTSSRAVYLDGQGRTLSQPSGMPQATGNDTRPTILAGACTPYSGKDNPHYSSGDVSGHGWWDRGSCSGATAHVYNCLYEWYTDNTWRQKACSPKKQLLPGGGSAQRTVARATCNPSSGYISWRNHVDVDVDGQSDTAEWPYNQADVVCVVY